MSHPSAVQIKFTSLTGFDLHCTIKFISASEFDLTWTKSCLLLCGTGRSKNIPIALKNGALTETMMLEVEVITWPWMLTIHGSRGVVKHIEHKARMKTWAAIQHNIEVRRHWGNLNEKYTNYMWQKDVISSESGGHKAKWAWRIFYKSLESTNSTAIQNRKSNLSAVSILCHCVSQSPDEWTSQRRFVLMLVTWMSKRLLKKKCENGNIKPTYRPKDLDLTG